MKSILFILAVVLYFPAQTIAQDLIVTDKGDSLNCKITKTRGDYIHFIFKFGDEIRSTLLPQYRVVVYEKDFFNRTELPDNIAQRNSKHTKFRINVSGGYSYLLGRVSDNVPPFLRDYMKKLKSGYHLGADASFFFSENIGIGLKYSMFKTRNVIGNVVFLLDAETDETMIGLIKDDITQHYIGPAFCTRFYSKSKKTAFLSSISLGYINYRNYATQLYDFTLTGSSVGLVWDFGIDFIVGDKLALGLGFACTLGSISSFKVNDGTSTHTLKLDAENSENISRLDLGIGLRWHL